MFCLFVCLFCWWLKTEYSMQRIISKVLISQQEGLYEWWFSGSWFQLWVCRSSHGLAVSPNRPVFPIHQSSCFGEEPFETLLWKKKNTRVVLIVPCSFPHTAQLCSMEKLTSYGKAWPLLPLKSSKQKYIKLIKQLLSRTPSIFPRLFQDPFTVKWEESLKQGLWGFRPLIDCSFGRNLYDITISNPDYMFQIHMHHRSQLCRKIYIPSKSLLKSANRNPSHTVLQFDWPLWLAW